MYYDQANVRYDMEVNEDFLTYYCSETNGFCSFIRRSAIEITACI